MDAIGWRALDSAGKNRVRQGISAALTCPSRLRTQGKRAFAEFKVQGVQLVLVPGDSAVLGWRQRRMNTNILAAWRNSTLGFDSLDAWLTSACSPLRRADLGPTLMEIEPTPIQAILSVLDDEERDRFESTFDAVVFVLARQGFRLPTEDELEYAYTPTGDLFPWGNRWPSHVPTDPQSECGVATLTHPHMVELTSRRGVYKGGDGGALRCGGVDAPLVHATFLGSWVTQSESTALLEEAYVRRVRNCPI